jgi:hypothetical protein
MAASRGRGTRMRNRGDTVWVSEHPFAGPWMPIASAPRDGRLIRLSDLETCSVEMAWNRTGSNPLVSRKLGIWETVPSGHATWCEDDGAGPTHWRPCDAELQAWLLENASNLAEETKHG